MASMTAQEMIRLADELYASWTTRNYQIQEWYQLITMYDKLKEEKLESFVSNEPRTFFNLALHLLVPDVISPRIPLEQIEPTDIDDVNVIEAFLSSQWRELERLSYMRGRGGWVRELVSFLLITGWYSVLSMVTENEIIAEVWNPYDVYPEFGDEGLFRCAHIYSVPGKVANRKAAIKGWKLSRQFSSYEWVKIYDYYTLESGTLEHGIVVGDEFAVPFGKEPTLDRIPIYCSPVAGLPDRGSITTGIGSAWKRHVGESLLSTNSNIYDYTNKLMTFMMQLLRDTAQTRWVEYSAGEAKVKPEDIFKRGAVFHLGMNEKLEPLSMPAIPIELRTMMFDVSAMRQKGALPDVLYGNMQVALSGYLMSQISGAAAHVLRPYQQALRFLLEEMCNDWLDDIRNYGYSPMGIKLPKKEFPRVQIDLRLDIPGDLVQRATVAKMLDPNFSLSQETVSDLFFPEIKNPVAEQAKSNRDRAMQHPVMQTLHLMEALRTRAAMLREAGDTKTAAIYDKVADSLVGQLQPQQPQPAPAPSRIEEQYPIQLPPQGGR